MLKSAIEPPIQPDRRERERERGLLSLRGRSVQPPVLQLPLFAVGTDPLSAAATAAAAAAAAEGRLNY